MRRPSPATAIALLALFAALGGTAFAAVVLKPGQVKRKHVAKNAITTKKVKNGSLRAADFRASEVPPGPTGPTGAQGAPGTPGADGKPFDANATLPPGGTLSGVFGGRSDTTMHEVVGFRIPLAEAIEPGDAHYRVDGAPPTTDCPGPGQAGPGQLCLYETYASGTSDGDFIDPEAGSDGGASRVGFLITIPVTAATGFAYGTWSVTAP